MNNRARKKYCNYWGHKARTGDLPKTCYNEFCPKNRLYGDCRYKKCRISLIRPTMENDFNEAKQR